MQSGLYVHSMTFLIHVVCINGNGLGSRSCRRVQMSRHKREFPEALVLRLRQLILFGLRFELLGLCPLGYIVKPWV